MPGAGRSVAGVLAEWVLEEVGGPRNDRSFILADKEGVIRRRADCGGAPKYTMYVPEIPVGGIKAAPGGEAL
ncbi:MAG TPA: hypothetical protein VNT60_02235 [Deinococcales bacterium]|nr:hypothetical protein [Deinococcales bacterium]